MKIRRFDKSQLLSAAWAGRQLLLFSKRLYIKEICMCARGSVLDSTAWGFLSGGISAACVWLQYLVSFSLSNLYQFLFFVAILRGALCHIKSASKIWQHRMASHSLSRLYNICCYFQMCSKPFGFSDWPFKDRPCGLSCYK